MTPPQSQMETDKEQIMVVSPPEQLSRNDDDYDDECDDDDDVDEDHHDLSFACHEHRASAEYHKPPVGWNCDNHNYHG